jgi:hypothetical protein
MKIFKDFKCQESGTVFDRRVTCDITIVKCKCGSEAKKVITAPKFLGNSTGGNASFKQARK